MITKGERWYATGKRKSAVARVWLTPGTGQVNVRKWRIMPKGATSTITYNDPKTGDTVEAPILFSDKVAEGEYAVPYTAKAGKKPFRYTPIDEYFGRETLRMIIQQPFDMTKTVGNFDVWVNVKGGGLSGQAGAIRHGIAKALSVYERDQADRGLTSEASDDEEAPARTPIRLTLKRAGLLTRDARVKERKKYGQPGARKRFQYSKR